MPSRHARQNPLDAERPHKQDQDAAMEKAFTKDLVAALMEAQTRNASRTVQQLATSAYDKLQYDFPFIEAAELQALLILFK